MDDSKSHHRIRHPLTIYVDKVEFEPTIDTQGITRTAYDLELTEYDMKKLYEGLKERLENKVVIATRIRITGRLVS